MREKLRKYSSDILYYSLSFIATLIAWLAHHLDRIGVLKEVDFALELMWWLILMLFVWAGELLPVEEPDYGPEILFLSLHCSFRYSFVGFKNAPLPLALRVHGFGVVFQPRTFSAQELSTSELLRTL